MRSPWQVLKSFASRGKPEDVQSLPDDVPGASEPSDNATSTEPPAELTAPDTQISQVSAGATEEQVRVSNADPVRTKPAPGGSSPPPTEPTDPVAAVQNVIDGRATINAKAQKPHARQVKTQRTKEQLPAARDNRSIPPAQLPAPQAPLSDRDQAAELDAEIKDLRSRLAQKLLEQNEQLRIMLDRYDD